MKTKKQTPVQAWISDYKKQFQRYNNYCQSNDWTILGNKTDAELDEDNLDIQTEYDAQLTIVKTITDRLKYFVTKFEPYLKYKYSKDFIDIMMSSVNLYIERCNNYVDSNDWLGLKDKEEQVREIEFQSKIVTDSNKVKDRLRTLNLENETTVIDLPIHSDKKVPFLMGGIVEKRYESIKEFKETVLVDNPPIITPNLTAYDVNSSTEMFINMKKPPIYDPKLHYFEQTKEVTDFYEMELEKMRNGVTIAGVYIHGWLYFHINYFLTDIPSVMLKGTRFYDPNQERIITHPLLRDNELFFADSYMKADELNVGLLLFGTRRYSKTVIESSVLAWRTTIMESSESIVIGGDDGDLKKLSKTLEIAFTNMHHAFRLPRNNNDWNAQIQFGLKSKTHERIPYADIFIKNVAGGTASGSLKTAGVTPTAFIVDEIGKFACKKMYQQAIPSFQNPEGWGCVPLLVGTGGESTLSKDAKEMLLNPEINRVLPMDWEHFENKYVPDRKHITWKRKTFGIFAPAQMSFKTGLVKEKTNMANFFKVDDKDLEKVDLQITNWELANKVIKEDRAKLAKKPNDLNDEMMGYPIDPLECFLAKIENPFPAVEAQVHLEDIEERGDIGKYVEIYQKKGKELGFKFSDKMYAPYPFDGGNIDAPVVIFETPPEDPISDGTYVAGLDHYKHDKSSTDSLGSLIVFKRMVNLNDEYSNKVVAMYVSRPETMEKFNETAEKILEGYGAECLQENADIAFQQHLRRKNKDMILLANGEDMAKAMINSSASQNNKVGLNPTSKNQQFLLKLCIDYCQENIVIGKDDDGIDITVKGVTRIKDVGLLKEIIDFNYSGNFDRIIAFGHALAWARYLDSLNIMPKVRKNRENSTYKKQLRRNRQTHNSPYATRSFNPYS